MMRASRQDAGRRADEREPPVRRSGRSSIETLVSQTATPTRGDRPPAVQARLSVGAADDRWEREAESVAERVVRGPAPTDAAPDAGTSPRDSTPRTTSAVQRAAGDASVATPAASSPPGVSGSGRPLDPATRAYMEPRFGAGFGDVRVHTGPQAARAARAINARAYTSGTHVVFGAGEYDPASKGGKRLLAHELAHVIQQTGPVAPSAAPAVQRAAIDDAGPRYDVDDTLRTLGIALRVALMAQKDPAIPAERKAKIRTLFNRLLPVLGKLEKARDKDGEGVSFGFDADPKKNEIVAGDADRSLASLYQGWIDPPTPTKGGGGNPDLQAWALPGGLHLTPFLGSGPQRCAFLCVGVVVLAGLLLAGCKSEPSNKRTTACSADDKKTIKGFHNTGAKWVDTAVSCLAAYRGGTASEDVKKVVALALQQNIHSTADTHVKTLETNLKAIQTFFAKGADTINYRCQCSGAGDAYTLGAGDTAQIHLCPKWFDSKDDLRRATTVIHEVGHATGLDGSLPITSGQVEDVYEFHKGYKSLAPAKALKNPDPHAVFVRQVFHDGHHGPGTHK